MINYLHYNYYLKVKQDIPTDIPLNTIWWHFVGHSVVRRQKKFGRRRRNIIVLDRVLKKQILIKTLNTLEALAYMKNRFLLLNMEKDEIDKGRGPVRLRTYEQKEWVPGYFLRQFREVPKIEDYISGKRVVVRYLPKEFPTVLINLLAYPADIQIAEANNINVLSFSFCGPITKSFIISKFRVPFNLRKQSHTRLLRKLIFMRLFRKTTYISRNLALIRFERLLCSITNFNKYFIRKILKKKISYKFNTSIITNKNTKKILLNNIKLKLVSYKKNKVILKKEIKKPKKSLKIMFKNDIAKQAKNPVENMIYIDESTTSFEKALAESLRVKTPPQTFIFGRQLK